MAVLNILLLDQFSEPGGAQQCLLDLLPALLARGWRATVAAPGHGALAERAVALGAKFHPIRCGPFSSGRKSLSDVLRFARQKPELAREIAAFPADVIYVNGPRLLPAVPRGRPVIFHCHNYLGRRYIRWLAGSAIRRTEATVIASCRFVLEPLGRFAGRTHVVYNGVGQPGCTREGGFDRKPFHIGVIGRIAPQKGQAEFLRAARLLEGCRFTICGAPLFGDPGHLDELRRLAAGLPVEFAGWREEVSGILSSLDLLVVPSTVPESSPRVILEAFATGVPVLASGCGGIPEVIDHNRSGFLIQSLAPKVLADQIRGLIVRPELLAAVAGNARETWRARHTVEQYRQQIVSIMETVCRRA